MHFPSAVLQFSWAIIADIDIESEKWRCCGGARFTWAGVVRALCLRKYTGRLWFLPAASTSPIVTPLLPSASAPTAGADTVGTVGAGAGTGAGVGAGAGASAGASAGRVSNDRDSASGAVVSHDGVGVGLDVAAGVSSHGAEELPADGTGASTDGAGDAADVGGEHRFPSHGPALEEPVPATWRVRCRKPRMGIMLMLLCTSDWCRTVLVEAGSRPW